MTGHLPPRSSNAPTSLLPAAQRDALAGSLRRIEVLAVLLGAPAGGRGDSSMECALVAEAADMIAEEARRMREQFGFLPP